MESDDIVVQVVVLIGGSCAGCGKGLVGRERVGRLEKGQISPGQRRMESVKGDFLG